METKNCQNCKKDFTVEAEDFAFYEKLHVPAPLTCSTCRFERRLMFRNERTLYRRECAKCGKAAVAIFAPESPQPVYCPACWWGDGWDAREYGLDYDPSRPFFEQVRELQSRVPCAALIIGYSSLVRSEYVNHAGASKDCYLIFNADFCENVLYSSTLTHVQDSMDSSLVQDSELVYESVDCIGTKIFFSDNCRSCVETYFSKDCVGCLNVFGCIGLRNKSYHIFNKPVSREEFERFVADARLDTRDGVDAMRARADEFFLSYPRKALYGTHNVNSTGDYLYNSKNAKGCYQVVGLEDGAYCQFLTLKPTRDAYDLTEWGMNSERIVDAITVGENCTNVKYCAGAWLNCSNVEYCMYTVSSSDCFGCVNLRKGQYCILNKQYTKEEYERIRAEIVASMTAAPYTDAKGRVFPYGEFFPYDLSYFAHNESQATQYWPKGEEELAALGYRYRRPDSSPHRPTIAYHDLPASIEAVPDDVTKEVLECVSCARPYKIVPPELKMLRRFRFSIPAKCPDCRHLARLVRLNPPELYDRACAKCHQAIKTAYSPDRPEIVYCESCYQQEIL